MEGEQSGSEKLIHILDSISDRSGKIFSWLIMVLLLEVTYEVFARSFFNAPTTWSYDMTYMLYGTHFMIGTAFTLLKKEHIRMDMVYDKFSDRGKGILDAVIYLFFFFPGLIFFFWAALDSAIYSWSVLESSDATPWRPAIYPFKSVLPVAILLLMLQVVSEFLKSARAALGRRPA